MNNLELSILGIFDVMGYLLISMSLLKKERMDINSKLYFFISATIAMVAITFLFPREYAIFLNFLNFYISTIVFLAKKWKDSLLLFSISMSLLFTSQLPLILILNFFNANIKDNFLAGFICQSFFLIIYFLIYKRVKTYILWEYINKNFNVFLIAIINMMLIGLCTLIFYSLDVERFIELLLYFLTVSFLLIAVNVLLINQSIKNVHQEEMQKKQSEYLETITSLVEEIKEVQHEYDNHIQGLKLAGEVFNQDQENDILNYINDIEGKQWFRNILKKLNPVLMGVLIIKYRKAQEKEVELEIRNHNLEMKIPVKDYELTEMMGILTDNAIENTRPGGSVIVEFKKNGFYVKNSHEYLSGEIISRMFAKGYSTKKVPSGVGLCNLKRIVDKYHGQIEIYNEENKGENFFVFSVSI